MTNETKTNTDKATDMAATHSFTYMGTTGYVFDGGIIKWGNVTAHIDDISGGLRTRAILCAKAVR